MSPAIATPSIAAPLRRTGIGVVGDVPWGTHFFMFHETNADLLDTLVPFFKAGLESDEFCVWIISEPLREEEVYDALLDGVPHFRRYWDQGSIEILQGREWYLTGDDLDLDRVARGWNDKMSSALAKGYAGLRISADTAWLEKRNWKEFCAYEDEVNHAITDWRMIALCTYPLIGCAAAEILDVTRCHQFAIARRNRQWEIVETSELKQAKAEIQKLNEELEQRVRERTQQLMAANEELQRQMSERQRAEEALLGARAELAHITRVTAMGELAASIAHEVTQPLTGIVTNGNACLRWLEGATPNIAKARAAVERIIRDGRRASEVINEIRTLVKKVPPHREVVDINDLIQRTITLTAGELNKNQVQVDTDYATDLPPVTADRVQLQQVILNLIINANEALNLVANRPRKLTVQTRRPDDQNVQVIVRDNGIGLDTGQVEQVFDAFYTTKPQGMGMGLSICRTIIAAHGGTLASSANEEHGASFRFTIPLVEAQGE